MNLSSRILPPGNIVLDLAATSKKRAFEHAGLLFENHQGVARMSVFHSLLARERLGSTALGHDVAIPHGRLKDLREPHAAFIRLASSIRFDANDGRTARLLFFLLMPEAATQTHLDLLAGIARLLSDAQVRQTLAQSTDPQQIHQLILNGAQSPTTDHADHPRADS
ncbi:PTS sugar transporter subunit IIA [uncultured Castellaniella sp.]|uniref:PTS sugar transporter subunit IIA n=1 Tax=uncultured Castellaniella sp. TaxID=647907 RepID=UPI00261653E7|nr:PTS sugar transporter subunit IIA [uncultured Castellaniella sp.]